MQKIIVITVKNGAKYQIGLDKSVSAILNELSACKSDYYSVIDNCAIRVSEIVSVEKFDVDFSEDNREESTE